MFVLFIIVLIVLFPVSDSYQDSGGCVEAESSQSAVAGPEPPALEVGELWEH